MPQTDNNSFPVPRHDHARCVAAAMARAERICGERGLRWTPLRQRVFELLWQSHTPVTAYDLLEQLGENGRRAQAPTVYRSLDFLLETGLAHRIESLNAYIGCNQPREHQRTGLLICKGCGEVAELTDSAITQGLEQHARRLGFEIHTPVIEVSGLCSRCQA